MRIVQPDFAESFSCLAGDCPDSCCRQRWQIPVDPEHMERYRTLPGKLGQTIRDALDGHCLRKNSGGCALLRSDGLCPIVADLGEGALCRICQTHPRFLEQYGGTREIHFSLSCPEAARLSLLREEPIRFTGTVTDEEVTEYNTLDPDEYLALVRIRAFAVHLMQQRRIPLLDRFALLLWLARPAQRYLQSGNSGPWLAAERKLRDRDTRTRILNKLHRTRLRGASYLPDLELLHRMESMTDEYPSALHDAAFTARPSRAFTENCSLAAEHMTVLWLSHYLLKAVNDGRADTKILLAVFLALTVRRFCVCAGRETPPDAARFAGLLAKELEHSEENLNALYRAFSKSDFWVRHLLTQLEPEKEDRNAI